MTLETSRDSYSGAGLGVLQLYFLKKCVACCVIVLSCDISSMSLFQTVYYYLNISHPLIDFLISLIHLGVLGFWGTDLEPAESMNPNPTKRHEATVGTMIRFL